MRIVLADGDQMFLNTLQAELRVQGHRVEVATNDDESIAVFDQFVPDIVILDGHLPPNGCDPVLMAMLDNPALSHLPVIVMMEEANNQFAGAKNHNVVAWIRKPFEYSELEEKITTATQAQPSSVPGIGDSI